MRNRYRRYAFTPNRLQLHRQQPNRGLRRRLYAGRRSFCCLGISYGCRWRLHLDTFASPRLGTSDDNYQRNQCPARRLPKLYQRRHVNRMDRDNPLVDCRHWRRIADMRNGGGCVAGEYGGKPSIGVCRRCPKRCPVERNAMGEIPEGWRPEDFALDAKGGEPCSC